MIPPDLTLLKFTDDSHEMKLPRGQTNIELYNHIFSTRGSDQHRMTASRASDPFL